MHNPNNRIVASLQPARLYDCPHPSAPAPRPRQVTALRKASEASQGDVRRYEVVMKQLDSVYLADRERVREAKRRAEQVAPMTDELREAFAGLPASVTEVEEAIEERRTEADAIVCANPRVMDEYRCTARRRAWAPSLPGVLVS